MGEHHCIVVGAGIVGSSCAWQLVKSGVKVTVLDPVLPGQATSFGNAGGISPSAVIPFSYPGVIRHVPRWLFDREGPLWIRWRHLPILLPWLWKFWRAGSMEQVEAIAEAQSGLMASVNADYDCILAETGSEWLREKRGLMMVYDSEAQFRADAWQFELRRRLGQNWQRLEPGEAGELEPGLALDGKLVLHDPVWSHLIDPAEVTRNIAEAAFAQGARWVQDRAKLLARADGGVRVSTESGVTIEGDSVVIAAGVWSNALLAPLGFTVPLAAKRGYHTMVHGPNLSLKHPVMSVTKFFMMTPMRLGIRVAGTSEFAAIDAAPDYRRARVLLELARHYLPGLEGESYSEWMGQRPMLPDSKPAIGPLPGHEGIFCAFGHGHYGLTQGPTTGRIIADLVNRREPHVDLRPFAVDRF